MHGWMQIFDHVLTACFSKVKKADEQKKEDISYSPPVRIIIIIWGKLRSSPRYASTHYPGTAGFYITRLPRASGMPHLNVLAFELVAHCFSSYLISVLIYLLAAKFPRDPIRRNTLLSVYSYSTGFCTSRCFASETRLLEDSPLWQQ